MFDCENLKSMIKDLIQPILKEFLERIESQSQEKHLAIQKFIKEFFAKNDEKISLSTSLIQEKKEESESSFSIFNSNSNERENKSKYSQNNIIIPEPTKDDKNKSQELSRNFPINVNGEFSLRNNLNRDISCQLNIPISNKLDITQGMNKTNQNSVDSFKQNIQQRDFIFKSVINISGNILITTSTSPSRYNILQIWDIQNKICQRNIYFDFPIYSIVNLWNEIIACGSSQGNLYIFNTNKNQIINKTQIHNSSILCLTLLSNGNLATGSEDKTIKIYNPNNFSAQIFLLSGHKQPVLIICEFSTKMIISSGNENLIYVWDIEKQKLLYNLVGHHELVTSIVKISDDEIASSSNGKLIIWDINKKELKITLSDNKMNNFTCLSLFWRWQ
jgi:hypothetical protein